MKTILSAILSIALISLLAGAGTFASFSDAEASSGNSFEAGTMDLVLTNTQLNPNGQWRISYPDAFYDSGDIRIHSCGNVDAEGLEIRFSLDEYEDVDGNLTTGYITDGTPAPEPDTVFGPGDMPEAFEIGRMYYEIQPGDLRTDIVGGSVTTFDSTYISDVNGNGYIDLYDLSQTTLDLPAPKSTGTEAPTYVDYAELGMEISMVDWDNEFQGDVIDMTVEVTLNQ